MVNGVTVFVLLRTSRHNQEWFEKLRTIISGIPEVVDFYRMSGTIDYLLRVVVPDISAYDAVYKKLTRDIEIFEVSSSFAMERIKYSTALPMRLSPAEPEAAPAPARRRTGAAR